MSNLAAALGYLYVPGDRPELLEKASRGAADAVIADLEDAVAAADKARARTAVRAWLGAPAAGGQQRWVRVDPDSLEADVAAVAGAGLDGLVVAKADRENLLRAGLLLDSAEREAGLPPGGIRLIPLIETAAALLDAPAVARSPRVLRLGIGEVDLAADLGLRPGADGAELLQLRFAIVAASAAAGISRPLAPTSTAFRDLEAFHRSSEALLRQGFRARTAIHPAQLQVIREVFTPTPEEVEAARQVVALLSAAGGGVVVDQRGRMVDAAVIRSAQEVLSTAHTSP